MAFTQEQLDNLADNNPDLHDKMWSKASDKLREMSVRDFEWELIDEDSTNGKVAFSVFQSLWIHSITREMKKMGDKRDD
tara:strand:+ start:1097 stop:1333 length:237 start_codon:yes stop_codon:yes gene_type:complete